MAEWRPKRIAELEDQRDRLADLAREQDEILRDLLDAIDAYGDPFQTGTGVWLDATRKKARATRARYEREVGNG